MESEASLTSDRLCVKRYLLPQRRHPSLVMGRVGVVCLVVVLAAGGCKLSVFTICQPDAGEIVFGSDLLDRTRARNCSHTFEQTGDFAFVAAFPRQVSGRVDIELIRDSEPARKTGEYTFSTPGNYLSAKWHLADLPGRGHYEIRVALGSEVLASGSFDLIGVAHESTSTRLSAHRAEIEKAWVSALRPPGRR